MSSKLQKGLCLFLLLLVLPLFAKESVQSSASDQEGEKKVKIIKHIATVVTWPANSIPRNILNICVLGDLPYRTLTQALNGTTIQNHKIAVRHCANLSETRKDCQIIYISKSEGDELDKIIQLFAKQPVLLLGDMDGFAQKGGSMNLVHLNETLSLTINLISLKNSNLTIDLKAYQDITVLPQKQDISN